ncbi:MAG: AAA family ATPase, partial [Geminicoccaceae bacterium]
YEVICCAYTNKAVNRMKEIGYPARKCRTVNRLLYTTGIMVEVAGYTFTEDQTDKILRSTDAGVADDILTKAGVTGGSSDMDPIAHRLMIYNLIKKGRGNRVSGTVLKTEEQLTKEGITRNTVIVVDELSMLPIDAADELHGFFRSVIYIGDPGQIPPVNSVDTCKYLSVDDEVELKTVHRVAGNDHLLDIIYALDEGKVPSGTQAISIDKFQHMARENFQFICYTNDGVAWMNEEARRTLGVEGKPRLDEPLITVTRTRAERHITIDDENRPWFEKNRARLAGQYVASKGQSGARFTDANGLLIMVTLYRMIQKNIVLKAAGEAHQDDDGGLFLMPVTEDGDPNFRVWLVRTAPFWSMKQGRKRAFRKVGKSMTLDFSYAITAHKAQGSEWPKVAILLRQIYRKDIGDQVMIDEVKRWNYTAATRGREDIQLFTSIIGCPYG